MMTVNWDEYSGKLTGATGTDTELLRKIGKGVVLDVGCGIGKHLAMLNNTKMRVGLDLGLSGLRKGKWSFPESVYICGSVYGLPFGEETFDAVIMIDVIEHLAEPERAIREVSRVLKGGGVLLLQSPNYPIKRFYDYCHFLRGSRVEWRDDPTHVSRFDSRSLISLVALSGFKVENVNARNILLDRYFPILRNVRKTVFGRYLGQKVIVVAKKCEGKTEMPKICFMGGTKYKKPLDRTSERKFGALETVGEVFVIAFSQDLLFRTFRQHAHLYLLPHFSLPVLRYATMFVVGPMLALWCILRHDVRIIIAQSPYEGCAGAWAKILARLFGRRVALIVESHGDFEVSLFLHRRVYLPGLYRLLMEQTARFALGHADVLRAISQATRRQLQAWESEKPMHHFPTWTDIDSFLEAGARRGQQTKEKIILYVGVLIPRKGVHFLLDAFSQIAEKIPAVCLRVIGKPENGVYAQALRNQVKLRGLEGQVCFLDPVSQRELARHMAEAEVLVLPSLSEGLGRVVFEAMACGTPVIGSHVDGIAEMILDKKNGFLVSPGDVPSLMDRILWVLQHPSEAREMGKQAREFARGFFSQETYIQNYMRICEVASQALEPHA